VRQGEGAGDGAPAGGVAESEVPTGGFSGGEAP